MRYSDVTCFAGASAAGPQYGPAIDFRLMALASGQLVMSNAVVVGGTFKLQMSNDVPPGGTMVPFSPTNWTDIAGATITTNINGAVGLSTTALLSAYWIRAAWIPDASQSGGQITAQIHCAGVVQ